MVILTRKLCESIYIVDNIKITVLDDKHKQVQLGIDAPNDAGIWREGINEKIPAEEQTGNRDV